MVTRLVPNLYYYVESKTSEYLTLCAILLFNLLLFSYIYKALTIGFSGLFQRLKFG
nr:MAG TPA: hypothetical protein [Caudoviricetes sp.]